MKPLNEMTMQEILNNIFEISKLPGGKERVRDAMTAAKISFGVHQQLSYLNDELQVFKRPLDYEEMNNLCNIMLYACCQATYAEIMAFVNSVPPNLLDEIDDTVGSC